MKIKLGELKRVIGSVVREMAGDKPYGTIVFTNQEKSDDFFGGIGFFESPGIKGLVDLPTPVTIRYEKDEHFDILDGDGNTYMESQLSDFAIKRITQEIKDVLQGGPGPEQAQASSGNRGEGSPVARAGSVARYRVGDFVRFEGLLGQPAVGKVRNVSPDGDELTVIYKGTIKTLPAAEVTRADPRMYAAQEIAYEKGGGLTDTSRT